MCYQWQWFMKRSWVLEEKRDLQKMIILWKIWSYVWMHAKA
jgi:hypothetical protein